MSGGSSLDGAEIVVFRVQAADGRGPWRPGLSKFWADPERTYLPADVLTAFAGTDWMARIPYGWHMGCACRSIERLLAWFTPMERGILEKVGYNPVALQVDRIIAENEDQLVFARRNPMNYGAIIRMPWRIDAEAFAP